MNTIMQKCKQILIDEGIDINSEIDFDVNGEIHTLNFLYIIEAFMQASQESQLTFLTSLQTALHTKDSGIDRFFEGMGQLLLMTHLSNKIEV